MDLLKILLVTGIFLALGISPVAALFDSTGYSYFKVLTITNNNSTVTLTSNSTINFTFDMAALVAAGKMSADGNDTRFTYSSGGLQELNWTNTSPLNTASTSIAIPVYSDIAASGTDTDYRMYYGDATPTESHPENLSGIWWWAWNREDLTQFDVEEIGAGVTVGVVDGGTDNARIVFNDTAHAGGNFARINTSQNLTRPLRIFQRWEVNDEDYGAAAGNPHYLYLGWSNGSSDGYSCFTNEGGGWAIAHTGLPASDTQDGPNATNTSIYNWECRINATRGIYFSVWNESETLVTLTNDGYAGEGADNLAISNSFYNFNPEPASSFWNISEYYIEKLIYPAPSVSEGAEQSVAATYELVSPVDDFVTNSRDMNFSFIVNLTNPGTATCDLFINSLARGENNTVANNTLTTILNNVSLNHGINPWFISCNGSLGNVSNSSTNNLNVTLVYDIDQNYTEDVIESSLHAYSILVEAGIDVEVNGTLYLNGTAFPSSSEVTVGNRTTITTTGQIPTIDVNEENITFYWNISYGGGYFISREITQTVFQAFLGACGGITNTTTLNFTLFDEDNHTIALYGDLEIAFTEVDVTGGNFSLNTSLSFTNQTYFEICIYPANETYTVDATLLYNSTDHVIRYYYLSNSVLDNVTDTIILYTELDSLAQSVKFIVKDVYHAAQEEAILKLQRYYVAQNEYIQVAMGQTGFDGTISIYLKPEEFYKILVEDDGTLLQEYTPRYITETEIELFVSLGELVEYYEYYDSIASHCEFQNDSQTLVCTYSDTSGRMVDATLLVEQIRPLGTWATVCEETSTATSGTLLCDLSAQNTTVRYSLTGSFCCSETTLYTLATGILDFAERIFDFGLTGVLIAFLLIMALILIGSFDPAASIVLGMVGIFISMTIGLIKFGTETFTAFAALMVVAAIIIYKVRR